MSKFLTLLGALVLVLLTFTAEASSIANETVAVGLNVTNATEAPIAAEPITPTSAPSDIPSAIPTVDPNKSPSATPVKITSVPAVPTAMSSDSPSDMPSGMPSDEPSDMPSGMPLAKPGFNNFAPLSAQSEVCQENDSCNALNLTGQCCPTAQNWTLDCCGGGPILPVDQTCAGNNQCVALGLTGSCCPTSDNSSKYLDCCSILPSKCQVEGTCNVTSATQYALELAANADKSTQSASGAATASFTKAWWSALLLAAAVASAL